MLRFKVLVSAVPLIVAAIVARVEFFPSPRPCIAVDAGTVEIASAPWHADLHVSFTDDPRLATVRVAIADNAEVFPASFAPRTMWSAASGLNDSFLSAKMPYRSR